MTDTRYNDQPDTSSRNKFREVEKLYRVPPQEKGKAGHRAHGVGTDFSNVIDFSNLSNNSLKNKQLIQRIEISTGQSEHFGPIKEAFAVSSLPGFVYIPSALNAEQQIYWCKKAIKEFPIGSPTNVSNLKRVNKRNQLREQQQQHNSHTVTPSDNNNDSNNKNNNNGNNKDTSGDDGTGGRSRCDEEDDDENEFVWYGEWQGEYMSELRWVTLGYHFQWTQRKYLDKYKGDFPRDLWQISFDFALQCGFGETNPEAATINYYSHSRQTMGGHLDNAEDDLTKPIVSYSFGNTVIFLIGGRTLDVAPIALFMRSGDVMIMGGESRYCFHGVPRMLENTMPTFFETSRTSTNNSQVQLLDSDWEDCRHYFQNSSGGARVNINTRQVRLHNKTTTTTTTTTNLK